ncbi:MULTISPECIES: DUF262 domain-containing protein [Nostocales]|jgi:hypothetical protein|uniref:DUF262 domain-containing protein n=2 Tax=Dolichospermum flosaquae TaxID=1166 RepID=A0ACC7SAY0_DOLFA|nr:MULTISPECIES: DUF262 domain-containing protein [Nostocales]MTJ45708.1 DUF262 domain-containing protein [Dolichospermum flos-aquae UHCC 0037]QSV73648.1 MAG: DUF262 domain-containing protein [Aphanizomenon flos-aquae KM1D3_PB]ALB41365.1 hypethetical protein [Anabaena sp. WA102]KHG41808.1 hypethetical protein [Aphanizomenon flos-aquae 2012/KM1/D3]MBO1065014.1 DUF262 domain-containing protein [Anabaena sp. 54]
MQTKTMPNEEVILFEEEEDQEIEFEPLSGLIPELKQIPEIVVSGSDWTTETIFNQLDRGNIELNPRFQRRDAWDITRKSRFIESLVLGFPVPQIVLAANRQEKGKFIVLDGKQRLLTILQFYGGSDENISNNNNAFALRNLEFRRDLIGKKYEDFKNDVFLSSELNALDNQTIRTVLIRNWPNENLLYKIFLRLNIGGTPLSPQELRQALHPGDFINWLDDQSVESKALRKIFKSSNPDSRMRDVELLLRYIGFHYFLSDYRGNLKEFLDMTCERLNNQRCNDITNVVNQFEEAVQTTINIFEEKNFSRLWSSRNNKYQSQFNRAILDVMVFYFSDEIIRKSAEDHQEKVKVAFQELCSSNSDFREAVERRTQNIPEIYNRLRLWGESLQKVLEVNFNLPELDGNRIIFNGLR